MSEEPPPSELLVARRASEAWAPTTDDLALAAVLDECAHLRAYGGRETRWLDDALRVARAGVVRDQRSYQARQLAAARATLGRKA